MASQPFVWGSVIAATTFSCCVCCWRGASTLVEERGTCLAAAVLRSTVVRDTAAQTLVDVLEHQSVRDGCVQLLQRVLADTRTVRAGQGWVSSVVTQLKPSSQPQNDSIQPPPSANLSQKDDILAHPPGFLNEKTEDGDADMAPLNGDSLQSGERTITNPDYAGEISRQASAVLAEIFSSAAMEHEIHRLLRSTLREPAIQEAAADAVGGVGRLTAAAAAQALANAVLPWKWGAAR